MTKSEYEQAVRDEVAGAVRERMTAIAPPEPIGEIIGPSDNHPYPRLYSYREPRMDEVGLTLYPAARAHPAIAPDALPAGEDTLTPAGTTFTESLRGFASFCETMSRGPGLDPADCLMAARKFEDAADVLAAMRAATGSEDAKLVSLLRGRDMHGFEGFQEAFPDPLCTRAAARIESLSAQNAELRAATGSEDLGMVNLDSDAYLVTRLHNRNDARKHRDRLVDEAAARIESLSAQNAELRAATGLSDEAVAEFRKCRDDLGDARHENAAKDGLLRRAYAYLRDEGIYPDICQDIESALASAGADDA